MATRKPLFLNVSGGFVDYDEIDPAADDITLAGIQINGNIGVTGTVDGRDVGNDGAVLDVIDQIRTDRVEPQGFVNRTDSQISFDAGTRTFSIQPTGVDYDFYANGTRYTKTGTDSVVIPDTEGTHFFYFDSSGVLQTTTTFSPSIINTWAYVANLYWDATNNAVITFGEERHGIIMDSATHLHLHLSLGTQFASGLALGNMDTDQNGSLSAHAQFSVANGQIRDEDIPLVVTDGSPQDLDPNAVIPILYRSGASGDWRLKTADGFPLIYSGTAGYTGANNRPPWNEYTGATWQLTETTANGYFILMHFFATNDINTPILGIQGQAEYSTLSAARAAASVELTSLVGDGLPLQEWAAIATVIYESDNTYANTPNVATRTTSEGDDYVDWRDANITPTGGVSSNDHGNLSGLTDDDHTRYLDLAGNAARNTVIGDIDVNGTLDVIGGNLTLPQANDPSTLPGAEGRVAWDIDDDLPYFHDGTSWQRLEAFLTHDQLGTLGSGGHSEYLLLDGTRAMAAALNMGNFDITNMGAADADGEAIAYGQTSANLAGLDIDTNPITMNSQKVTGLGSATTDGDALAYGQTGANLAGLTIDTNVLNMSSQKITGLADGVNPNDAVNKGQLDTAIISGGVVKELILHFSQLSNSQGMLAAMATFFTANPTTGDTIVITDGTTTRTYGAGTGGDVQYTIGATASDTMTNFVAAVNGDGSAIWDAILTDELDDINPGGVIVLIEQTAAAGNSTSRVYGTWGDNTDWQVVEYASGGTVDLDYRESTSTDSASSDPGEGRFGTRRQLSALSDFEIHFVREDDSHYAWDEADDVWQILGGAGSIPDATEASGGGIKGKLTVDSDLGLQVLSGVLGIDLSGTPGLQFNGGDLEVKPDGSQAIEVNASGVGVVVESDGAIVFDGTNGGLETNLESTNPTLEIVGNELGVKFSTTAGGLDQDATGLKVKVDGVTTTINGSGQIVADITNPVAENFAVNEAITLGDPVYLSSTNDRVAKADAARAQWPTKAQVMGVARTSQGTVGQTSNIISQGPCPGILVGATAGVAYYLQVGGGISTTIPAASNAIIRVGWAINATDLFVSIRDTGLRAA